MAKMKASTRGWIVKLYKSGANIDEIHAKVREKAPKITKVSINAAIRRHLVNLADELWSTAVKVKFGWKCAISNKTDNLESHHLIGRGNKTHRWSIENGICLNSYYHTLSSEIAAHGATDVTEQFREWMIRTRPEQWAWFEEHKNDKSVTPDLAEMLVIVKRLEGATKNGYSIGTDIGERRQV